MNRPKFSRICRAAMAGEDKYLKNTDNNHAGRVLACFGDKVEVVSSGRRESWSREDCQEYRREGDDYRI